MTACKLENWAEQLIISLMEGGDEDTFLKTKIRQMIMNNFFLKQRTLLF